MSQVTEADLALALHNKLLSDPKTRRKTLDLYKELNPNASIPEIDAAKPYVEELGKLREDIEKMRTERANEKQDDDLRQRFANLKQKRSYTDEGITEIQKLMVDKAIADPDAAADHFDKLHTKPLPVAPASWASSTAGLNAQQEDFKAWLEKPTAMLDQAINETLADLRNGR